MTDERTETPAGAPISPADIQKQEFGVSRFGGYRMRDVDEFLDRLTASTESLVAENERLRSGASPIVGTSDLDDVNRQADEILQRAREQAARIVAEAKANATPRAAEGSADRPAVDAFLQQERAFLQNLAGLVQGHAESVKAMARKTRQPATAATQPTSTGDATAATQTDEPAHAASAGPVADSQQEDNAGRHTDTEPIAAGAGDTGDETVVIEVPQPAPTPGGDREPDGGDPSLKKLFWGEDR
jgi:DivIVA domain-containing protein